MIPIKPLTNHIFKTECLKRVERITGKTIDVVYIDVNDTANLDKLFKENNFYAVLHLAALKAVGESCVKPLEYYHNNVAGSINLLRVIFHLNNLKI